MARGTLRLISSESKARVFSRHQVGLVEHDEIGAKQLIFVNLFKRVVVIDGRDPRRVALQFSPGHRQSGRP